MARIDRNSGRKLLYLLFFYICKIKSVKNIEERELKKIDLRDKDKTINTILVDMCFKIVQEPKIISWYGKILVNENKYINESEIKKPLNKHIKSINFWL